MLSNVSGIHVAHNTCAIKVSIAVTTSLSFLIIVNYWPINFKTIIITSLEYSLYVNKFLIRIICYFEIYIY